MIAELQAPWFGLHLRHGNSLIGARRSTYSVAEARNKAYLTQEPKHHPLTSLKQAIANVEKDITVSGRIHQFLLPSQGWGAAAEAKDLKDIAKKEIADLKKWRLNVRNKLTDHQIKALQDVAVRVEQLWQFALIRTELAEDQARRDVPIWGRETTNTAKNVTRNDIEKDLFNNADGAYRRLRLIMDAWYALWFWPLDATTPPPDINEWIRTLQSIVGTTAKTSAKNAQQYALGQAPTWDEINAAEETDRFVSGALKSIELLDAHPWLRTVQEVTAAQNFFHWDLDFAAVMAKGGFDLQVGNPPWVRPRTDVDALLSEIDPWFSLAHKPTQKEKKEQRETVLQDEAARTILLRGIAEVVATSEVLTDPTLYSHLQGQQPDLYRGFMARTWGNASLRGVISLIHPESHFTEKKAVALRSTAYLRLRRHWQFLNMLNLFDIDGHVVYGIHVYSNPINNPQFLMASTLFHPQTITESLLHNGIGELPGIKDPNYNWDRRPHRDRIITVDESTLEVWNSILEEPGTPLLHTRMVYTVNSEASKVLEKLARAPRMKTLGLQFSRGWDESIDKKKGYFDSKWEVPSSWNDVILQGPHLGVSTPMIKQPNETMKHNQDWTEVDLEAMPADFIPATAYQPDRQEKPDYDAAYGSWEIDGKPIPVSSTYRVAWREMAATTGYRTLYPTIVPVGARHVNAVNSCALPNSPIALIEAGAIMSTFLIDFYVRSAGTSHIFNDIIRGLPYVHEFNLYRSLTTKYLQLNCLTASYAPLWEEITGETWTPETPIRNALERQKAQTEIDAIVALCLDVTVDELCMIYRTQFPVMRRYDQENHFDAHGRLVPKSILKEHSKLKNDDRLSESALTWTHPQSNVTYVFEYPFTVFDREAALRAAYAKYKEMM